MEKEILLHETEYVTRMPIAKDMKYYKKNIEKGVTHKYLIYGDP